MALAITAFRLTLTLAGEVLGTQVNRSQTFEIAASGVDEATMRTNAQSAADSIASAYGAITDLAVVKQELTEVQEDSAAAIPAVNPYNTMELSIALNETGTKTAPFRVMSPTANAVSGRNYDASFAGWLTLINYFKAAQFGRLSDGETARDTEPILGGRVKVEKTGKRFS